MTGEGGPSAPTSSGVALGAGVVVGLLVVVMSASYASLIFRGPLADRLPLGVAILLASAVVHAVVLAFTSRFEGLVARPQSPIVPILGLMAAAIVVAVPEGSSDDTVLATVVAALIVASLLTGGVVGAIGVFGLGRFIRFIPHPVIGGFLAGSGYLLLRGGLEVLLETDVLVGAGDAWVDRWEIWVPGILFALLTTLVLRRSRHPLALPALIVGGVGLFYGTAFVAGVDFAEVRGAGWFLVDVDDRTLWQGIDASLLGDVEWLVVAAQWPSFATVALVSAVSVLLTLTAMELQTGNDADLDRELRSAGLSNVLAGLAGGVVGYHSLSLSTLAGKLGARSRSIGIIVALVAAGALFVDARPIGLVPVWLVGGLLCYLGIEFLVEWLWEARRTLTRGDFLVVVLIVVTTGLVGYIQAIGLGVVLAVVLFVVKYSRVDAVKHLLSGRDHRSNVERPRTDRELLRVHGDRIRLIVLQGFVFFGTASRVLESVRAMFLEPESMHPSHLVIDFRRVTGMDSSATMSLAKLLRLAGSHDCVVVLSGMDGELRRQVEASEVGPFDPVILKDLDHASEWCEDQVLGGLTDTPGAHPGFRTVLSDAFSDPSRIDAFLARLDRVSFAPGDLIVRQGDEADTVFFVESGRVSVFLALEDGTDLRLRAMGPGAIIGELALYLGGYRTATVIADEPTEALAMSNDALAEMERDAPELAAEFHRFAARLSAERLLGANKAVRALLY